MIDPYSYIIISVNAVRPTARPAFEGFLLPLPGVVGANVEPPQAPE